MVAYKNRCTKSQNQETCNRRTDFVQNVKDLPFWNISLMTVLLTTVCFITGGSVGGIHYLYSCMAV